ncbi:metal-binding protein [Leptolyngbya sp. FACHB-261]|uniref:metal-binding protein n=1 Tax=Leptolyngbya sp. FACHB-261 TaxID=2692806 RepID=UPI001686A29D|nr:metal-binding protein [Leptolyngbya sp. FACHB-261]MBD2100375.1 metal-binding protein [Leptolyngbya sp. FACHB-261]
MPLGRTHDQITLWTLPLISGASYWGTRSGELSLLLSGSYLFAGLMFGGDLDIHSQQYKRWGILRWLWLPYRKSMRHRSFLSHGPVVGTVLRLAYLACWVLPVVLLILWGWYQTQGWLWQWRPIAKAGLALFTTFPLQWLAILVGLELGAMSHSLSDWIGSGLKKLRGPSKKRSASKFRQAERRNRSSKF